MKIKYKLVSTLQELFYELMNDEILATIIRLQIIGFHELISSGNHEINPLTAAITSLVSQKLSHPWLRGSQRPDEKTLSTFPSLTSSGNWSSDFMIHFMIAFLSLEVLDFLILKLQLQKKRQQRRSPTRRWKKYKLWLLSF